MQWHIGTMGFSYDDWRGIFFPASLKLGDRLAFYARQYDCVELDTTFHAAPPPERFKRWAEAVPAGFRFSVKAPRAVTHETRMADSLAGLCNFVNAASALGDKLSVILLQYPPTLAADAIGEFERLLPRLGTRVRFAVEFRHDSWFRPHPLGRLTRLLQDHNAALVAAEYLTQPREPIATADFAYVRLIGQHGRFEPMNHERFDPTEKLHTWKSRIEDLGVAKAWMLLNNDFSGCSIHAADRLKRMIGQPVSEQRERLGTLF